MENVTSSWWTKLTFSSIKENSWSFSSQVPSPSFLEEDHLTFVEEQRWFLRHCWPHEIKLGESNRLKAYPRSFLFSHCLNCKERDGVESKLSLVAKTDGVWIDNNKSMVFHRAICNQRTLPVLMETLGCRGEKVILSSSRYVTDWMLLRDVRAYIFSFFEKMVIDCQWNLT